MCLYIVLLVRILLKSLLNDKILEWSKLKAFADDKIKSGKGMIFVFDRVENIVGKGENAENQHVLLFPPQCLFLLLLLLLFIFFFFCNGGGVVKSRDCVVKS